MLEAYRLTRKDGAPGIDCDDGWLRSEPGGQSLEKKGARAIRDLHLSCRTANSRQHAEIAQKS
jgi:hypothetical protein